MGQNGHESFPSIKISNGGLVVLWLNFEIVICIMCICILSEFALLGASCPMRKKP